METILFTTLETDRLMLRKFVDSDAEAFFAYRPLPDVALYQGEIWDHYTFEQAKEFVGIQKDAEPIGPDSWFQIAIELKSSGILIGDCVIHTLPQVNQAEIGFTISPVHQHKGYATEAASCLLGYLFNVLKKHRVIAIADARNLPSNQLLEKIGMRREGLFLKNAWYRGEYVDECAYAILKEEWDLHTLCPGPGAGKGGSI